MASKKRITPATIRTTPAKINQPSPLLVHTSLSPSVGVPGLCYFAGTRGTGFQRWRGDLAPAGGGGARREQRPAAWAAVRHSGRAD